MKKVLLLIVALLIIVLGYIVFFELPKLPKKVEKGSLEDLQVRYPIPQAIIDRADKAIIEKVGETYFKNNYKYYPEKSYTSDPNTDQYFVYYNYLPLTKLSDQVETIAMRVFANGGAGPVSTGICDVSCEPKISKKQAIEIVTNQNVPNFNRFGRLFITVADPNSIGSFGLNKIDTSKYTNLQWEFTITQSSGEGERIYRIIWVDTVTGEFTDRGEMRWG